MKKFWILSILVCVMTVAIASCNVNSSGAAGNIVVASKDFTEQDILGELLAQQIEDTTDLTVTRRPRLGGSFVCHNAILAGQVDAYIEYTGTAFTAILKQEPINDPKVVHEKLKEAYSDQFNLEVMPSLGFENTFAMIIRGEDAERYNIQTLSESAQYTPEWRGGFGYEFVEREDGLPGLAKTYGLNFAQSPKTMDLGLIYQALIEKQVDIVAGNSTDGQISRLGLVVLEDDKKYFPPYEATPIVRKETLAKYPQLKTAINQLSGKITADEMRKLNNLVEGESRDIQTVVREFRQSQGLSS
ncbi:glycine betaine ABC transporter substrate-binding protein [Nodularia harveyana UHCC-0300]|uniref:Glycine betaine ABC transporter substrate-binding protein n=1 Tax=Nodularia harveyana UHCC-0300 TaxID=2974287 RepID=A0ABU5UJ97_9CYAN|nr:glycine betaine ABC transporter substrate-binding protein [Nodularia harveyana]MEA5583269.1 glycine betaine ABC transporter substrate-binding protein [Nodularia harveyana UHCC-0300]